MAKGNIVDALAVLFDGFDYRVEPDDFLLYEIGRLIEEDRASLEDEEFRRLIDGGIRQHIEERPEIRAEMAARLRAAVERLDPGARPIGARVVAALEDIEIPLRNIGLIVRSYTAYIFRRLEESAGESNEHEDEARSSIERWQRGEVLREEMVKQLKAIGRPALAPLADLLFDSLDDRSAAEAAIDVLGGIRSSTSARVLAHVISEPMMEEELELKAYDLVRSLWPLPRHYILSVLSPHTHEDLPFRWFQLLIDRGEIYAVDLVLEELVVHGANPSFLEDLASLTSLLHASRDPEIEDKVLQVLNAADTPRPAAKLLEDFLREYEPSPSVEGNPWSRLAHLRAVNRKYLAAAKLFDAGRKDEALAELENLLKEESGYPFAVMLIALNCRGAL